MCSCTLSCAQFCVFPDAHVDKYEGPEPRVGMLHVYMHSDSCSRGCLCLVVECRSLVVVGLNQVQRVKLFVWVLYQSDDVVVGIHVRNYIHVFK